MDIDLNFSIGQIEAAQKLGDSAKITIRFNVM